MGLAASQARFLCLTARKANCEYKSTALAQEKLEITNQMSTISNEYAQALNATKLMWSNDGVEGDYGLTYGLLMSPSPMNDFNPYMVTTPSGAVVLNNKYAAAARAAGISKAGGLGSQQSRDKFISALMAQGLVTETTAKEITQYDYEPEVDTTINKITFTNENNVVADHSYVQWNPAAGMGAEPKNKGDVETMNLTQMALSETIGEKILDWAKIFVETGKMTEIEYNDELKRLGALKVSLNTGTISEDVRNQLSKDLADYQAKHETEKETDAYKKEVERLTALIECASSTNGGYKTNENGEYIYGGNIIKENGIAVRDLSHLSINENGEYMDSSHVTITTALGNTIKADYYSEIRNQIIKDYNDFVSENNAKKVSLDEKFNVKGNSLKFADNGNKPYTVVYNGVINHYSDEIKNMTIGDLLTQQVVLMANNSIDDGDASADLRAFSKAATKMLDSIAAILGYSASESLRGKGLNVDDASEKALKFAYDMVKNTYLKTNNIESKGSRTNEKSMTENTAYINATTYNRIGTDSSNTYYAISLSQMTAAFLTYFDNGIAGADSSYVVGKSVETSVYVTDNSGYQYFVQPDEDAEDKVVNKTADFFDELYNNILEHGWREDAAIDDNEYFEASLKNGKYTMCSLNKDGYYYQTRYSDTGYMVEVSDTDAIERAEAEFTAMKAQLTYKEDMIDIKTKNLDAEIAALTTEVDSVKNMITKGIEKTFSMFAN